MTAAALAPVALTACATYEFSDLDAALDRVLSHIGDLASLVMPGDQVVLKPNLIAAMAPERAATTHPALLEALARRALDCGAKVAIADAPAWGGPGSVGAACGIDDVCARLGIPFWFLDQRTSMPSAVPTVAKRFHVDPRIRDADVLINVPKLKCHMQLGFTGAMKNLYGCMSGREKAFHHGARGSEDAQFARFLVAYAASIEAAIPRHLHVLDGIWMMEGPGPRLGMRREAGLLAAGRQAVAVDQVAAEVLQAPVSHRLLLEAAVDVGLLSSDERPELRGEPLERLRLNDVVFPHLIGVFFSPWRLARGWWRNRRLLRADRDGVGATA